jgi:tetratricopeptide (TPR) repeat protein
MSQFLSTRRYLDDWEDCARRAVAAARAAGDERGEAAALLQLADRSADAGRSGEAARRLVRAIRLLRRGGDPRALAIALTTRALLLLDRNGPAAAQRDAENALDLLPPAGPTPRPAPPGEFGPALEAADPARCRALTALGLSYLKQGNHDAAYDCFGKVLDGQRTVRGRAEARYRLGTVHLLQGDYRTAAQELADAMQAAYQAGDLMTAMIAQVRLGQVHVQMGALDQAQPLLEHAASRLSHDDSPKLQALSMQGLTRIRELQDQVPRRRAAARPQGVEPQGFRLAGIPVQAAPIPALYQPPA